MTASGRQGRVETEQVQIPLRGAIPVLATLLLVAASALEKGVPADTGDRTLNWPVYGAAFPVASGVGSRSLHASAETVQAWSGVRHVPMDDMQLVADSLGGTVVEIIVETETASQVKTMLDQVEAAGYVAIVNMYTSRTVTKRPWYWNGSRWVFPRSAVETLHGIAHHPALLAIYALHEPFEEGEAHLTVEQQQALYTLLRGYTDGVPVFSDVAALGPWEDAGVNLTDGICDYCCTFPSHFRSDWSSERCVTETLRRIDDDVDTQRRLMPNSQVVFQINTYAHLNYRYPVRLPTVEELVAVRDYLCDVHQPMMYYPWSHNLYDATLKDAPQLWPRVAEGCAHNAHLPLVLRDVQ